MSYIQFHIAKFQFRDRQSLRNKLQSLTIVSQTSVMKNPRDVLTWEKQAATEFIVDSLCPTFYSIVFCPSVHLSRDS